MTPKLINHFFHTLANELHLKATIILTGAAAGNLYGGVRPSQDIDFAIKIASRSPRAWAEVEKAVRQTIKITKTNASFAEDIDRWGMISLLDYEKHVKRYKAFGTLNVFLLHPAYWAIGKVTRYLRSDEEDLVRVFRKTKISWRPLARVWAEALESSPRSTSLGLFVQHATHFFETHGRRIWGKSFDPERARKIFTIP